MGRRGTRRLRTAHGGVLPKSYAYAALMETIRRSSKPGALHGIRLSLNRLNAIAQPKKSKKS